MSVLGEVPSRRLGRPPDEDADDDGGDAGAAHHEPPVQTDDAGLVWNEVKGQVGNVANHYAKGRPHLPLHDERTSEFWRGTFCSKDGYHAY